jgi:hypothetical protein
MRLALGSVIVRALARPGCVEGRERGREHVVQLDPARIDLVVEIGRARLGLAALPGHAITLAHERIELRGDVLERRADLAPRGLSIALAIEGGLDIGPHAREREAATIELLADGPQRAANLRSVEAPGHQRAAVGPEQRQLTGIRVGGRRLVAAALAVLMLGLGQQRAIGDRSGPLVLLPLACEVLLAQARGDRDQPRARVLLTTEVLALLALQLVAAARELLDALTVAGDRRVDGRELVGGRVLGRATQRTRLAVDELGSMRGHVADGLERTQTVLGLGVALLGLLELALDPAALGDSMIALDDLLGLLALELALGRARALALGSDVQQPSQALATAIDRVLTPTQLGQPRQRR